MNNLLCDKDGVPLLIQRLIYRYGASIFEATFFNGKKKRFTTDYLGVMVSITAMDATNMQYLEAENQIAIHAIMNWRKWFTRKPERPDFTARIGTQMEITDPAALEVIKNKSGIKNIQNTKNNNLVNVMPTA